MAHIGQLRQAEPAVLPGDLDAERAQLPQALNHRLGDFAFAIDAVRVDVVPQEALELVEEGLGAADLLRSLLGIGVHEVEPQPAQEQIADEARRGPLLLACGLGDFAGLVGADLALRRRDGSGHGNLLL